MTRLFFKITLITTFLISSTTLLAKDVRYVSDDLTIPMRTGTTTNHKILKFLNSGIAVEILEELEDKSYARVQLLEDESKSGWVETRLLMAQPSARERLEDLKKTYKIVSEKRDVLQQELKASGQQNQQLENQVSQLEKQIDELETRLAQLRKSASNPIRIAEENQQLKQELTIEQEKNASLIEQNAFLADQNIKQWFMIGAAVSLGSLILGLLITRINWKKRDSWGGSF